MLPEAAADAAVLEGCLLGAMVMERVVSASLSSLLSSSSSSSMPQRSHVGSGTNPTWILLGS